MSNNPIIINQSAPNLQGQADVKLRKNDFNANVWNKGTDVFVEKAMRCPCKPEGDQPLSSCLNCGGMGWFFIQKRTTKMLIQSADSKWTFSKQWSEELQGTVRVTALERENLTNMDRITIRSGISYFTQPIHLQYNTIEKCFVGRAFYEILQITEAFLFVDEKQPLQRLAYNKDYTYKGNTLFIDKSAFVTSNENRSITISIRYAHNPQYHVVNMNREYITQVQRSFEDGRLNDDKFPAHAMAQKAHYCFDQLNYYDLSGDALQFIDNSYDPNENCDIDEQLSKINSCIVPQSNIVDFIENKISTNFTQTGYITVPHNNNVSFNLVDQFTFSIWIKINSLSSNNQFILSKGTVNGYSLQLNNTQLLFSCYDSNGSFTVKVDHNITNYGWHHLTVTNNGSGINTGINILQDGVKLNSTVDVVGLPVSNIVNNQNIDLGFNYLGVLDEFIIWNRTLTQSEVLEEYNNCTNKVPTKEANVVYWNRLGDDAFWNGTHYTYPDNSSNNITASSINLLQNSLIIDTISTASL